MAKVRLKSVILSRFLDVSRTFKTSNASQVCVAGTSQDGGAVPLLAAHTVKHATSCLRHGSRALSSRPEGATALVAPAVHLRGGVLHHVEPMAKHLRRVVCAVADVRSAGGCWLEAATARAAQIALDGFCGERAHLSLIHI
eukprot:673744-Prymnesium_polylepis.1